MLVGMLIGATTVKNSMEDPSGNRAAKMLLGISGRGHELWEAVWCPEKSLGSSSLFAIFYSILGPDFPFLQNGNNDYLLELL